MLGLLAMRGLSIHSSEGLCVPQSCSPVRDRFRGGPFRTGSLVLQSLALRPRARQPRDRAQQGRVRSFCLRACVVMRCGDDREDQEVPLLRSGLLYSGGPVRIKAHILSSCSNMVEVLTDEFRAPAAPRAMMQLQLGGGIPRPRAPIT